MMPRTCICCMVVAGCVAMLAPGCSPTGWAVRELPDGSNLRPGDNVTITQQDGSVVTGEFVCQAAVPAGEYPGQYERAASVQTDGMELPSLGQTIRLSTAVYDTKSWTGQLVGFDLENMWVKFPGDAEAEPVYFSSLRTLSDANGELIHQGALRSLFLNGEIPLMSALRLKSGAGEVDVPVSSIRQLIVEDPARSYVAIDREALLEWHLRSAAAFGSMSAD